MLENILHILGFILIFVLICFILYYSRKNCKNRNMISENFTDTLKVYLLAQNILTISKANFVVFFKYKYEASFIKTHFMFSIDDKNNIDHELMCDTPVSTTFSINIFKSDDKTLHELYKDDMTDSDSLKKFFNNTYKAYFQNLFKKDVEHPIGYISICYEKEHKLSDKNIEKIMIIIQDIKKLI